MLSSETANTKINLTYGDLDNLFKDMVKFETKQNTKKVKSVVKGSTINPGAAGNMRPKSTNVGGKKHQTNPNSGLPSFRDDQDAVKFHVKRLQAYQ
jgi:hypothetical protein